MLDIQSIALPTFNPFDSLDLGPILATSYAPITPTYVRQSRSHPSDIPLPKTLHRTSHSVFVKNVCLDNSEFAAMIKFFPDIYLISSDVSKKTVILTFEDSRSTEQFVRLTNKKVIDGQTVISRLHFKNANSGNTDHFVSSSVSLKYIRETFLPMKIEFEKQEIEDVIAHHFGEIRQIIEYSRGNYVIEFYNFKHAANLCKNGKIVINHRVYVMESVDDINEKIAKFGNLNGPHKSKPSQ